MSSRLAVDCDLLGYYVLLELAWSNCTFCIFAETIFQEFWCNSNVCISRNNSLHIYCGVSALWTICTSRLVT